MKCDSRKTAVDNINSIRAFLEVARTTSFSEASEKLGYSTSKTSRLVKEIEDSLGFPLFRRTTRKVSLTYEGERYFHEYQKIINALDAIQHEAQSETETLRGVLKVTTTAEYAQQRIVPLLPDFLERHPELTLDLNLSDTRTDLVASSMDMAIRVGDPPDSSMIGRKLSQVRLCLVASPGFIDRYGMPQGMRDLRNFPCVICTVPRFKNRWPLNPTIEVKGPVVTDQGETARECVIAGLGISLLPYYFVEKALNNGEVIELFKEEFQASVNVWILFPGRFQITPAAKAFADFLFSKADKFREFNQLSQ